MATTTRTQVSEGPGGVAVAAPPVVPAGDRDRAPPVAEHGQDPLRRHLPQARRVQAGGVNDYYFGDPVGDFGYPLGAMQMLGKSEAVLIGFEAPGPTTPSRSPGTRWTSGSPPRTSRERRTG